MVAGGLNTVPAGVGGQGAAAEGTTGALKKFLILSLLEKEGMEPNGARSTPCSQGMCLVRNTTDWSRNHPSPGDVQPPGPRCKFNFIANGVKAVAHLEPFHGQVWPSKTLGLNALLLFFPLAFNVTFSSENWLSTLLVAVCEGAQALLPGAQAGSGHEKGRARGGGRDITTVFAFLNTRAGGGCQTNTPGVPQRGP